MANRLLFDSLLTSQRWNDLGHAAQNFYVRLMLVVDDFGAFDGRESVIANACYPTQRVDVSELLAALHAAELITRYSNAGKPFVAIMRWQNEVRGKRRFPAPPLNNDAHDLKLQGKYGRPVGWRNPGGTDAVSIELDAQMRPAVPQPREWRMVDKDYAPQRDGDQALHTVVSKPSAPVVDKPYAPPDAQPLSTGSGTGSGLGEGKAVKAKAQVPAQDAPQHGAQPLPATPAANGGIELKDNGEWHGVSEEQRLRWQAMFDALSIPDQLQRAGQWLVAKPDKRAEYSSVPGGLQSFLINWLLRESRGLKPH